MKKFNKSKVIIPALAMIALTTAASATGTVAWFTANQTVIATGLAATVSAGDNLFIAKNTSDFAAASSYSTSVSYTGDASALAPVSTVDGKKYYTADSVDANGKSASATGYTLVASNTPATGKVGYIEYDVYLKGTNDGSAEKNVTLNTLALQYQATSATADISGIKAFRVAVLATDNNATAWSAQTTTDAELKAIYAPGTATNFETGKAVGTVGAGLGLTGVTYNGATTIGAIAAGATEYFRVQVRLYVEGEDTTCLNSLFANKTANWKFDIGFAINNGSYAQVSALAISQITA
ncbi:MAG: hypothetical protein K5762_02605 [Bacilli bacterium]|nr:hypothetical protein [Bacilli bacterium]